MASPESAVPPPIGVESTWEANGMGPGSASLARMRREVEASLAEHAAAAMKLEAVMATLGVELVGSDVYSRVWELAPLVLAGDRLYSEMVTLLEWGRRRVLAARTLQAAARCRLRRPLGPNRDGVTLAGWCCTARICRNVGSGLRAGCTPAEATSRCVPSPERAARYC